MLVEFKTNIGNLMRETQMDWKRAGVAAQRALNAAARGLRTDASRELKKRYPKLSTRDVSSMITIRFATATDPRAYVIASGRPLSLMRFYSGQVTKRGRGGVYVNVKGQRHFLPHAWVQTLKSRSGDDYQVIFDREGPGRLPVKVLKTIDIPNAMHIEQVWQVLDEMVRNRFDAEFTRQIKVLA